MTGTRRKTRAITLQVLYEVDSVGHEAERVITYLIGKEDLSEENKEFIRHLVSGIIQKKEAIDLSIQRFAPAWPLDQMAVIDRSILRLAIFEILFDNRVSVKVAINEAIVLAKHFGSENSPKFINGVLGSISTLVDR
jgi:N utilization substance protein B